MSYLRWSFSDWYVFAHTGGGLAVWSRFSSDQPTYTNGDIVDLLTAVTPMSTIPGWGMTSMSERLALILAMREFLAEEADEEVPAIAKIRREIEKSGPCPMCGAEREP